MAHKGTLPIHCAISYTKRCTYNTTDYVHKTVTLKCCIKSNEIANDTSNIRLPSTNDWDKNLKSILSKVKRKFKLISTMDDSEWMITINNIVIDKTDSTQLSKLLPSIPPVAIIEIVNIHFMIF